MSDDGTGGNLFIPSLLISYTDTAILKQSLLDPDLSDLLQMKITFEMRHTSNHVNLDLWMSSEIPIIRRFLNDFSQYAVTFTASELTFRPRFVSSYCPRCHDSNYTVDDINCISGGRYCAPDPDGPGSLTGRDTILENLRQLCVSRISTNLKKPEMWWNYISSFNTTCHYTDLSADCSEKAMRKAKIDLDKVDNCVTGSFDGENQGLAENSIMKDERSDFM
jgi:hypothetical protein